MVDAPVTNSPLTLALLSGTVANILGARDNVDNFPHLYRPSERPIVRIGFALEPDPSLTGWVVQQNLDALFIHRPWRLDTDALPEAVGVVAYHQPFDATLAVGYNRYLADDLGLGNLTPLGEKDGVPLGMIGDARPDSWSLWDQRIRREFGGVERVSPPRRTEVARIAVVGAMNDALVRDAVRAGADVYITGQMRFPGRDAVQDTGVGVVAVGHARGERWGLDKLATLLRQQYPALVTVIR